MPARPAVLTEGVIRPARREDCPAILEIYNEAVQNTTASYDIEPRTLEHRIRWFEDHQDNGLPVFVAERKHVVLGWSSLSRYHDRYGYRFTVENSVYVAADFRGRGLGSRLLNPLIEAARLRGFHAIIAGVDATNEASLRLHARFGFEKVGHFRQVGHKFGRWLDVVYLERLLEVEDAGGAAQGDAVDAADAADDPRFDLGRGPA